MDVYEAYFRRRAAMIDKEVDHMHACEGKLGDPWIRRLRATRAIDADFARILADLRRRIERSR